MEPDPDPNIDQKADLDLCIICQERNDEILVEKPTSHEKTLESIKEWATYGEIKYIISRNKLSFYSLNDLKEKSSWQEYSSLGYAEKSERAVRKVFLREIR